MDYKPEQSLCLTGDIDSQTLPRVTEEMSKLYSSNPELEITLFINSGGGNVTDAFALYDFSMSILKPKLQTVALGEVNSMAVILFLMGERRFISNLTVMRFHQFSFTPNSSINLKIGTKMLEDLYRSQKNYIKILTSRTNGKISEEAANALLDNNAVVTAIEAVELGLAHEIS